MAKLSAICGASHIGSLDSSGHTQAGIGVVHTSLIVAASRPSEPEETIGGLAARILAEDRSAFLLTATDSAVPDESRILMVARGESAERRSAVYSRISSALRAYGITRILAIPQSREDLLSTIAAADVTGAPLAVYLTGSHDFHADSSKCELLDEALRKTKLCFAISNRLRAEIQKQYGKKVWVLPPLIPTGAFDEQGLSRLPRAPSCEGFIAWIWNSLEAGIPIDDRFERFSSSLGDKLTPYVDPPAPPEVHWEMEPHFQALYRLRACGYGPDFVVDVGASTGYWSYIATKIFPSSQYFLIEPLLERYLEIEAAIYRLHPEFVQVRAAAGNVAGEIEMNVSPDLYRSSFFHFSCSSDGRRWQTVLVPVRTLDEIAVTERIKGRGLLKMDVQFSEHLVLEGAAEFLKKVDAIFIEVSLRRSVPECKTFVEIANQQHELGFEYHDYAGTWRDPATGELLQQDAVFTRSTL